MYVYCIHICIHSMYTHTCLTALCPGLPGWAGTRKVKTNLDFTGARDSEWQWHQLGMCKSAPRSRQITTQAPHHSVFLQAGCPSCRPTNSVKALKALSIPCICEINTSVNCKHHRHDKPGTISIRRISQRLQSSSLISSISNCSYRWPLVFAKSHRTRPYSYFKNLT